MSSWQEERRGMGAIYEETKELQKQLLNNEIPNFDFTFHHLHFACGNGFYESAKFLLQKGIISDNAFYNACSGGNIEIVKLLLPTCDNPYDRIDGASYNNHTEIVKFLFDPQKTSSKQIQIGFRHACYNGNAELAKLFLANGADPTKDKYLLAHAITEGYHEIEKVLVECGVDKIFAMKYSIRSGELRNVKRLIQLGTPIKWEDGSILSYACCSNKLEIVRFIVEHPEISQKDLRFGLNVACSGGHEGIVKFLLDRGIEIDPFDRPIYYASNTGHAKIVKLLLDSGDSLQSGNDYSIERACLNGHKEVVEVLLQAYGKIVPKSSTLDSAIQNNHYEIAKMLVNHGVRPYNKDTCLKNIINRGNLALLNLLTKLGVTSTFQDSLQLLKNGKLEMIKVLLNNNCVETNVFDSNDKMMNNELYNHNINTISILLQIPQLTSFISSVYTIEYFDENLYLQ